MQLINRSAIRKTTEGKERDKYNHEEGGRKYAIGYLLTHCVKYQDAKSLEVCTPANVVIRKRSCVASGRGLCLDKFPKEYPINSTTWKEKSLTEDQTPMTPLHVSFQSELDAWVTGVLEIITLLKGWSSGIGRTVPQAPRPRSPKRLGQERQFQTPFVHNALMEAPQ